MTAWLSLRKERALATGGRDQLCGTRGPGVLAQGHPSLSMGPLCGSQFLIFCSFTEFII